MNSYQGLDTRIYHGFWMKKLINIVLVEGGRIPLLMFTKNLKEKKTQNDRCKN